MDSEKPLAEFIPGKYQGATYQLFLYPDRLVCHARYQGQPYEQNFELRTLSPYCDRGTYHARDYPTAIATGVLVGFMAYLILAYGPRVKEVSETTWGLVSLVLGSVVAGLTLYSRRRAINMAAFKNIQGQVLCSVVLTEENSAAFEDFLKVFAAQVRKAGDK